MLDFLTRKPLLRAGRFGQFARTKQLGAPIDFVWPCTNSGDGDGVAFIKVLEGGLPLWVGPPFPIPIDQTVPVNLHQTIDLSLGLHNTVPQLYEGFPPDGVRLIETDTLALTVVSNPILAPVGNPQIDGQDGPTVIILVIPIGQTRAVSISWMCGNTGGGSGLARIRLTGSGGGSGAAFVGTLVTIPGFSNET